MTPSNTLLTPELTAVSLAETRWELTNNSGLDIVVIDAYAPDSSSARQLYEQQLTVLKLVDDGAVAIKNNNTQAVALPEVHQDKNGNLLDYTLILANAKTLFPVQVVELSGQENPPSFPALAVTAADVAGMKQADMFVKTIQAYPSSDLALAYAKLLTDPNGDEETINAFFRQNESYQTVTLSKVVAVQTYYSRFPFAWADYKNAKTLYLYTSDGTTNKFVGSVALENQTIAPASVPAALDGFTATFITTNGADSTLLYYADGQFVDDVAAETPAYCLRGLFTLRSDLTGVATDNSFMPVLTGVVNGVAVFSYDQKQTRDQNGDYSGLDVLHHPEDTRAWLGLLGLLAVCGVGFVLLAITIKYVYALAKLQAMTPAELAAERQRIETAEKARYQAVLEKARTTDRNIVLPDDINLSLAQAKQAAEQRLLESSTSKIMDLYIQQDAIYQKVADLTSNSSMQKVAENLGDIFDRITYEGRPYYYDKMDTLIDTFKYNSVTLDSVVKANAKNLSVAEKQIIETAQSTSKTVLDMMDTNEEYRQEIRENDLPEIEDLLF